MPRRITPKATGRASVSGEAAVRRFALSSYAETLVGRIARYHETMKLRRDVDGAGRALEVAAQSILSEAFLRLVAFPCLSSDDAKAKAGFLLQDEYVLGWLSHDEDAVRVLLSSLLSIKGASEHVDADPVFSALLAEFWMADLFWFGASKTRGAADVSAAQEAVGTIYANVLAYPCSSAHIAGRKCRFLLSEDKGMDFVNLQPDKITSLLQSFLALEGGDA